MAKRFLFGEWEIDQALHELHHRGRTVAVQPKTLEVLIYLVENRHRVVPRGELFEQIWGDVSVCEASLTNAIYQIRCCLEDRNQRERWAIQTVLGRGVRFIARLEEVACTSASAAADGVGGRSPVGRESALSALHGAWLEAVSGRGGIVMLHGELGIGKTRTAEAFAAELGSARVVVGHCYQRVRTPSFWPWTRILRDLIEDAPEENQRSAGPALAELGAELHRALLDADASALPTTRHARFRYLEAVRRLLTSLSRKMPLVLVLEDLHWADVDSLQLLDFLAGELTTERLLVLGTYRDDYVQSGHPLATLLGKLACSSHCLSISLQGLGKEDIRALLRLRTGWDPSPELVAAAKRRTRGNPFFLTEIARVLRSVPNGMQDVKALERTLPGELIHAISAALSTLSAATLTTLQAASVMGEEIRLDVLQRVLDAPGATLLDRLDEAIQAGVVSRTAGRAAHFNFEHVLYREVIYHGLRSSERARLCARLGEVLTGLVSPADASHLPELAHHPTEVVAGGGVRSREIETARGAPH